MEKKQTAVEWLFQRFQDGDMYNVEDAQRILQQAKQLEKKQMCEFVNKYIDDAYFDFAGKRGFICTPEEYYNDIYENTNRENN